MKLNKNDISYYFFVDKVNEKFPGLSKIIKKLNEEFINVRIINFLDLTKEYNKIIPIGIAASHLYLKKYKKGGIAFIIDASTLCFSSMCRFYIRRKIFFDKQLIGAFLRYIKYYYIEKKVVKNFDKVIVVSEHDAGYLRKKFNCSNVEVITNGADLPDFSKKQVKNFNFTLGILSYWGPGNYNDVNWFITDYLPRLKIFFPEIKLITAGRGANSNTLQLFHQNKIEHLGEIDDLWDFFNRIDIYITTLRKESGILNKVLDAMAHQKIVVGLEQNMYAFKKLKEGFFTYKNLEELIQNIDTIKNNQKSVDTKVSNAYKYILEHHNWGKNYQKMKLLIDNYYFM